MQPARSNSQERFYTQYEHVERKEHIPKGKREENQKVREKKEKQHSPKENKRRERNTYTLYSLVTRA